MEELKNRNQKLEKIQKSNIGNQKKPTYETKQLEEALETNYVSTSRMVNNNLLNLFLLGSIASILYCVFLIDSESQEIMNTVHLRLCTSIRKFSLIDMGNYIWELNLYLKGALPNDYAGSSNFLNETLNYLQDGKEYVLKNNKNVRNELHIIDDFIAKDYYIVDKEIEVVPRRYQESFQIKMNTFDLINSLISATNKILAQNQSSLTSDNIDLSYIQDNIHGGLLAKLDSEYEILNDHFSNSFLVLENFVYSCIGVFTFVALLILIFFLVTEARFRKKRNAFYGFYVLIDDKEVQSHLANLEDYYNLFEKNEQFEPIHVAKTKGLSEKSEAKVKNSTKYIKNSDLQRTDRNLAIRLFTLLVIVIIVPIFFYTFYQNINKFKSDFHQRMQAVSDILVSDEKKLGIYEI